MFIRYNGPKPIKRLEYVSKEWGLLQYTFDPVCKVTDPDFCKFLLNPDRLKLFSIVPDAEIEEPDKVKEGERPKGYLKPSLPDLQVPAKRKGRSRKAVQ
jgi:hypothetical protein